MSDSEQGILLPKRVRLNDADEIDLSLLRKRNLWNLPDSEEGSLLPKRVRQNDNATINVSLMRKRHYEASSSSSSSENETSDDILTIRRVKRTKVPRDPTHHDVIEIVRTHATKRGMDDSSDDDDEDRPIVRRRSQGKSRGLAPGLRLRGNKYSERDDDDEEDSFALRRRRRSRVDNTPKIEEITNKDEDLTTPFFDLHEHMAQMDVNGDGVPDAFITEMTMTPSSLPSVGPDVPRAFDTRSQSLLPMTVENFMHMIATGAIRHEAPQKQAHDPHSLFLGSDFGFTVATIPRKLVAPPSALPRDVLVMELPDAFVDGSELPNDPDEQAVHPSKLPAGKYAFILNADTETWTQYPLANNLIPGLEPTFPPSLRLARVFDPNYAILDQYGLSLDLPSGARVQLFKGGKVIVQGVDATPTRRWFAYYGAVDHFHETWRDTKSAIHSIRDKRTLQEFDAMRTLAHLRLYRYGCLEYNIDAADTGVVLPGNTFTMWDVLRCEIPQEEAAYLTKQVYHQLADILVVLATETNLIPYTIDPQFAIQMCAYPYVQTDAVPAFVIRVMLDGFRFLRPIGQTLDATTVETKLDQIRGTPGLSRNSFVPRRPQGQRTSNSIAVSLDQALYALNVALMTTMIYIDQRYYRQGEEKCLSSEWRDTLLTLNTKGLQNAPRGSHAAFIVGTMTSSRVQSLFGRELVKHVLQHVRTGEPCDPAQLQRLLTVDIF